MTAITSLLALILIYTFSFIVGYPLARFLTAASDGDPVDGASRRVVLMAPLLGYCLLSIAIFYVCVLLDVGTRPVAKPMTVAALVISCFVITFTKAWRSLLRIHLPLIAITTPIFLLATFHVIWPILAGWWTFAYATGDDAARWLMMVSHFQDGLWRYLESTNSSLAFSMRERPLYLYAGAYIASLFNLDAPVAYSVMTSFAAMLSAIATGLLFESFFPVLAGRWRWMIWLQVSVFTGFAGLMPNMLYNGFSTHHLSVFFVIASLAIFTVRDSFICRWIWFSFWGAMAGAWYTARYALLYWIFVGFMLLTRFFVQRKKGLHSFLLNYGAIILSVPIAILVNYSEVRYLLEAMGGSSVGLTLQKASGFYGGNAPAIERLLKYSGYLCIFDSYLGLPQWVVVPMVSTVITAFAGACWVAIRRIHIDGGSYVGLLLVNILLWLGLEVMGLTFMIFKTALYWPFFIMVGCLAGGFLLIEEEPGRKVRRTVGVLLLLAFPGIVLGSAYLTPYYWKMVDQRYTKVDALVLGVRQAISSHLQSSALCCGGSIYSFDFGVERAPLIREVFREFPWQPIRGLEFTYDIDVVSTNRLHWDEYRWDVLLVAEEFKGVFDFSGNDEQLITSAGPFKAFSAKSSLVEFRKGVEMALYDMGESVAARVFGLRFSESTATALFANNGGHDRLAFTFREKWAEGAVGTSDEVCVSINNAKPVCGMVTAAPTEIELSGLAGQRLARIQFKHSSGSGRLFITRVAWRRS